MKSHLRYLLLSVFVICCVACHKDNTVGGPDSIFGSWLFVEARGGFTGKDVVKANGKTVFVFNRDSSYQSLRNDTLLSKGKFHIRAEKSIYNGAMVPSLAFDNGPSGKLFTIKNDSLYLTDNHVEPYGALYVRLK